MIAESVEMLLAKLPSEPRAITMLKLEGHTNAEIGTKICRTEVTIDRQLRLIRVMWTA